jgi:hypothetical protein
MFPPAAFAYFFTAGESVNYTNAINEVRRQERISSGGKPFNRFRVNDSSLNSFI